MSWPTFVESKKKYEEAVQLYKEAVRAEADDPGLHVHLGYCYKTLKQYRAAEVEYRKGIQKDPKSFYGHLDLGWVLVRLKRDQEAEPHYQTAATLKPDSPLPHYNLGNLYLRQQEATRAEKHYAQAVALDPEAVDYRIAHARALWRAGRSSDARAELEAGARLGPSAQEKKTIDKLMRIVDRPAPKSVDGDAKADDVRRRPERSLSSESPAR